MKVCIVGNSDNLLTSNLGKVIDSFDEVIRINDFVIAGFEEHIGSKTTVISGGFSSTSNMVKGNYPTSPLLHECNVWVVHPDSSRINRVLFAGVDASNLTVIDRETYSFLQNDVYKDFWRNIPSVGIGTILMALIEFKNAEIFIAGFDNNTGKEGKGHYYQRDFILLVMTGDQKII